MDLKKMGRPLMDRAVILQCAIDGQVFYRRRNGNWRIGVTNRQADSTIVAKLVMAGELAHQGKDYNTLVKSDPAAVHAQREARKNEAHEQHQAYEKRRMAWYRNWAAAMTEAVQTNHADLISLLAEMNSQFALGEYDRLPPQVMPDAPSEYPQSVPPNVP